MMKSKDNVEWSVGQNDTEVFMVNQWKVKDKPYAPRSNYLNSNQDNNSAGDNIQQSTHPSWNISIQT